MCGIVGYVRERPDREILGRMLGAIRHRGPDDAGVYVDHRAALGHARLSIIDLAGGHQPIHNEDGTLTIVFNGEIFNYVELREWLLGRGHRFSTHTDTEVILHLYEEFGQECVSRLNGQWAFAIWNSREQTLFLSRDRLGVRPLFYANSGGAFLFASEIKGLFEYPGVTRELDPVALDDIFTFWHTLPPRTAFKGVCELPPGHSALLERGELKVSCYWEVDYSSGHSPNRTGENEYRDQLLALLTDATRLRLRADVPVGAYLSGGLDSTVIATLAREFAPRMRTFSIRFDEGDLDEGAHQNEAAARLGTEHHSIRCSAGDIGRVFPDVVRHLEKPVIRTAPAPMYLLAKLVRDCGHKVVLTGEGSDEVLGGYDIYKEAKVRMFCAAHPESRLRPLLLKRLYPYMPQIQSQPAHYLRWFFRVGDGEATHPFFSHLPRWRTTARGKALFSEAVTSGINGTDAPARMEALMPSRFSDWSTFERAQYLETRYLLPGYILSSQGDRVAMAHAVEGRFPFLDYRLVEFAGTLPPRLKMKVLKEKFLLKQCAKGLIPDSILERHKQPYRAPDARSFFGPDAPGYVADLLSPAQVRQDGIFRPEAVEVLARRARGGQMTGVSDNMAAVGVISTALLYQQYIAKNSVGA